jgi:hypothetical protein
MADAFRNSRNPDRFDGRACPSFTKIEENSIKMM